MKVALAMVATNITLNLFLIWRLQEAGMGWSTAICAALQCLILGALATRFAPDHDPLIDRHTISAILKILAAAALMGGIVWTVGHFMPTPELWTDELILLGTKSIAGAIAYLAASKLLRCHEFGWLLHRQRTSNPP